MPGQKSIYETFLAHTVLQLSMIVYELDYAYFIFFVYCLVYSTVMSIQGRGKDNNVRDALHLIFKLHEYELSYRRKTPVFGFLLCVVLRDDINPRLCLQNFFMAETTSALSMEKTRMKRITVIKSSNEISPNNKWPPF
jgi:hypothetical protein